MADGDGLCDHSYNRRVRTREGVVMAIKLDSYDINNQTHTTYLVDGYTKKRRLVTAHLVWMCEDKEESDRLTRLVDAFIKSVEGPAKTERGPHPGYAPYVE